MKPSTIHHGSNNPGPLRLFLLGRHAKQAQNERMKTCCQPAASRQILNPTTKGEREAEYPYQTDPMVLCVSLLGDFTRPAIKINYMLSAQMTAKVKVTKAKVTKKQWYFPFYVALL